MAGQRTLEAKISDGGPYNQRINPHVLTHQLWLLRQRGEVNYKLGPSARWYYLTDSSVEERAERLRELVEVHRKIYSRHVFYKRMGQALEIAVWRALKESYPRHVLGSFRDLDQHGDEEQYSKEEPPTHTGRGQGIGKKEVDFLLTTDDGGLAAVEVKNTRQWIYPGHGEIRDLLWKASKLDAVPVLVARRFHYLTFKLMHACGGIVHQTYNQRFPKADTDLAELAKDKNLLGYFDIRVGNQPDKRLLKFVSTNLPRVLPAARAKFDEHKGLVESYAEGDLEYKDFRELLGVAEEE